MGSALMTMMSNSCAGQNPAQVKLAQSQKQIEALSSQNAQLQSDKKNAQVSAERCEPLWSPQPWTKLLF
jgi:hypothetical protein